jgi:hypothetical protein
VPTRPPFVDPHGRDRDERAGSLSFGRQPLTATFAEVPFGAATLAINNKLVESGANVTAPVSGVITSWRIIGQGGPFALELLKPMAGGTYLGGASTPGGTIATYGLTTFAADLPIAAGETIAIEATHASDEIGNAEPATGSEFAYWAVPPTTTVATAPAATVANGELSFGATILPSPTITTVGTTTGSTGGGTSVSIAGSDFTEVKSVSFGPTAASSYVVNSEGQITAVSPAGAAGSVPISVTTIAGTATSSQQFIYQAPAAPGPYQHGPEAQGQESQSLEEKDQGRRLQGRQSHQAQRASKL